MTDLELGRLFHQRLGVIVTEDIHPDDDAHDAAVGKALRLAIDGGQPQLAVDGYNAWAQDAGYVPIRFLGVVGGCVRADIVTAVIDVDAAYGIHLAPQEASCQQ